MTSLNPTGKQKIIKSQILIIYLRDGSTSAAFWEERVYPPYGSLLGKSPTWLLCAGLERADTNKDCEFKCCGAVNKYQ